MEKQASILVFSTNKKDISTDFISKSLDQFSNTARCADKLILIADSLRAASYRIIDGYSDNKAKLICKETGDSLAELLTAQLKEKKLQFPIYRWDDLMRSHEYEQLYKSLSSQARTSPMALGELEALALNFLKERRTDRVWKQKHIDVSVDFLLQELGSWFYEFQLGGFTIIEVLYPASNYKSAVELVSGMTRVNSQLVTAAIPHQYTILDIADCQ